MSYDDSRSRGEPAFRSDPDQRADPDDSPIFGGTSSYPVSYPYPARGERTDGVDAPAGYNRSLDDVFDDPDQGEPGRDRLTIHLVWEIILLIAAAVVGYMLYRGHRAAITGAGLHELLVTATWLGLLVLAAGLSMRAAVPNLAIGPLALAASVYFAQHADAGLVAAGARAAVFALVVGAALAVLVVGLHVPAWAASFGAALGLVVWIQQRHGTVALPTGVYRPQPHATDWFVAFGVLALLGGIIGGVRSARRAVGRFRPVADPARRRGAAAGVMAVLALFGSSLLAVAAGILMALQAGSVRTVDTSLTLTGLAFGGALLAGTSAFGRRGGLAGAILSALLLTLVIRYLDVTDRRVSQLATAALAIGVGLIATRLVEAYGRPVARIDAETVPWGSLSPGSSTADTAGDNGWGGTRPSGWTSPLPASSADDRWGDDSWTGR